MKKNKLWIRTNVWHSWNCYSQILVNIKLIILWEYEIRFSINIISKSAKSSYAITKLKKLWLKLKVSMWYIIEKFQIYLFLINNYWYKASLSKIYFHDSQFSFCFLSMCFNFFAQFVLSICSKESICCWQHFTNLIVWKKNSQKNCCFSLKKIRKNYKKKKRKHI